MANPLHSLRIKAVELLRQPGAVQPIVDRIVPDALDIADHRVAGAIDVDLAATSTIDSIVVRGTVSVPYETVCRRCAIAIGGVGSAEVDELYQFEPNDDDAYLIDGALIDLAPVVRQYALLAIPDDVLCRDDCAGLCATCGADLNESACACDTTVRDPRWAALDDIQLDG